MKSKILLILVLCSFFLSGFIPNKSKPSTIFAHFEDNIDAPFSQPIPAQEWQSVMFTHSMGFGSQFSWIYPIFSSEIFLSSGTPYRAVGSVVISVDLGQCTARLLYEDGKGLQNEIEARTYPSNGKIIVITVEQSTYAINNVAGALLRLQVMCDYPAVISSGSLYVINQ